MGAEAHEVLTNRCLRAPQRRSELTNRTRTRLKLFDDAQAIGMGQCTQRRPTTAEDLGVKR